MKKPISILAVLFFLIALLHGTSFYEEVDLSGTWEGTTEVPDSPEPDKITLILEKSDGEYSGTISDSIGFAEDAELEDIKFEDNELSFNFTIFDGAEYLQVSVTLTVEGDKMSGYWELEDGESAPIELVKIK